ncbi:MAG: regulatory iron-sulfur-containing complex subunit RicT [Dehalococcoidales bacterium]|nr:regulatory iron-sulfur-containing complex subunit RicT [Dehalococcoidales bacterium]
MGKIVGVRLKKAKAVCFFDPGSETELNLDDRVIVETANGWEVSTVVVAPKEAPADQIKEPLKPIVRKATPEDIKRSVELEAKEKEALAECGKLVDKLKLPMKLTSADYDFDGKRVTIYFRSEERVDFRELVRELAGELRVRVELRQTRPRDEAKEIGGCGRCGRTLCCSSYLHEFAPVSIKMAKVQNLPLNPMKISGVCGRLMCCLVYENEFYQLMKGKMPRDNQRVSTATGPGKVVGNNPLKETVFVVLDETQATVELPLTEITLIKQEPLAAPAPKAKEPVPVRDRHPDTRAPSSTIQTVKTDPTTQQAPVKAEAPPAQAVKPVSQPEPAPAKAEQPAEKALPKEDIAVGQPVAKAEPPVPPAEPPAQP